MLLCGIIQRRQFILNLSSGTPQNHLFVLNQTKGESMSKAVQSSSPENKSNAGVRHDDSEDIDTASLIQIWMATGPESNY